MSLTLILGSLCLLLLAGAIELWWGIPARRLHANSLERMEAGLQQRAQAMLPAQTHPGRAQPARDTSASASMAQRPWDRLLLAAGLTPGAWTLTLILVPGLLLAVFAAVRIGTAWMAPLALAIYVLGAWFWLTRRVERLRRKLLAQLPDFLDNMVRLTTLGNSLPMAFQGASGQVAAPLRPLLEATLRNTRGGMDLDQALAAAARPYGLQALEVLSVVMGICIRIGGRADHILQRISDFMRDLAEAQQELRATTSETRGSAWVLGLLPPASALFMALLSPDFFHPLIEHSLGHKLIIGAVVLEAIGVILLYRLAKSL